MSLIKTVIVTKILEVSSAFYPEKNGIFSPNESFILPSQNTTVQFAAINDTTSSEMEMQLLTTREASVEISQGDTRAMSKQLKASLPKGVVCGPSPFINTMNCFSTKFTHYAKSVPIPGNLSTTPVFKENSWVIGTTKGFLFRVKAISEHNALPSIDPLETELWGSKSRDVMSDFVPETIYKETTTSTTPNISRPPLPKNYIWMFPTSSSFIGTPVISHGNVYALTANQSLQAINFETGKLVWSVKVTPDISFYLANNSIRVTHNLVLIGTNRGQLLALNPATGNQINTITLGNEGYDERFVGIVAAPLVIENNRAIVSNAASNTQNFSLETFETLWRYPDGSVVTPLLLNPSTVILTTTSGKIVSINERNGAVNWTANLEMNSPLMDTTAVNDMKTLLVTTKRGALIALDAATGKILAQNRPIGMVIGHFFKIPQYPNESCLSFSTGSFRCFKVQI